MNFNPGKPYNDLPFLPPKAEIETRAVLTKATLACLTQVIGDHNKLNCNKKPDCFKKDIIFEESEYPMFKWS